MARSERITITGQPHHVTQRGNFGTLVFTCADDFHAYKRILLEYRDAFQITFLAYALMNNHVHFIAIPGNQNSLSGFFRMVNSRYGKFGNTRHKRQGQLWQGRFYSKPLVLEHLQAAVRYIENNPVKAQLVATAAEYQWSSARFHVLNVDDPLLLPRTGWDKYFPETGDWAAWLAADSKL